MFCPTCGQSTPEPYDAAAEAARLDALANAIGLTAEEVTPARLGAAAKVAGCEWYDVTPAKLAGKEAAVRDAVAADLAEPSP